VQPPSSLAFGSALVAGAGAVAEAVARPRSRSRIAAGWRYLRRRPLVLASALFIVTMLVAALLAERVAPHDPVKTSFTELLRSPGAPYLLGTDQFGRDLLSRLIYGSRTALLVGFSSAFVGATSGAMIGVVSAYFGGKVDLVIQRLMDVILSFPLIILALGVVAALGLGTLNVIIAITIPTIPRVARVVRSSALTVRQMPYVEAARASGARHGRIIFRHLVPNVMAPYLVMLTAFLGQAILLEASLSFLGLGVAEPTPAWGLMLRGGSLQFAERAPWLAIFPGLAISLAVFAFNLLGDSLRDVLDPRLRIG
jgi:peptide/nickel transport system permease protein